MARVGLAYKSEFSQVLDQAFAYLASRQNISPDCSGWHQFVETDKIGNIATAQIMLAFAAHSRSIPNRAGCFTSFTSNAKDLVWNDQRISGWSYCSSGPPAPCLEPTCWVYMAHKVLAAPGLSRVETSTRDFLRHTVQETPEGCAWSFTPWTESRIAPTCLAVRTLRQIGGEEKLLAKAKRWLLNASAKDGIWGPKRGSSATVTHTAFAVIALTEAGLESPHPMMLKAYDFLHNNLSDALSRKKTWSVKSRDIWGFSDGLEVPPRTGITQGHSRVRYNYNPLQLAALALSTSQQQLYKSCLQATTIYAINSWKTSQWKHPFMDGDYRITSWSFYDNMQVLHQCDNTWEIDQNASVCYFFTRQAQHFIRIPKGADLAKIAKNPLVSLVLRGVIFAVFIALLCWLIPSKVGLGGALTAIILGFVASALYDFFKKRL